jgi:hypothetical protein
VVLSNVNPDGLHVNEVMSTPIRQQSSVASTDSFPWHGIELDCVDSVDGLSGAISQHNDADAMFIVNTTNSTPESKFWQPVLILSLRIRVLDTECPRNSIF